MPRPMSQRVRSNPANSPMNLYAEYERRVRLKSKLILLQCDMDTSRLEQLRLLLEKSTDMVSGITTNLRSGTD